MKQLTHLAVQCLKNQGYYNAADLEMFEKQLRFKEYKKDDLFLKKGELCSSVAFVLKGAMFQYLLDDNLEKQIIDLYIESDWAFNHKSFTKRKPSEYYIQCLEDTSVFFLSIDDIHYLIGQSQAFLQMGKIMENATSRVHFFDTNSSPDQKYQFVLETKPNLLQKFPQKMVASYLKITPETLSRVRARFYKDSGIS